MPLPPLALGAASMGIQSGLNAITGGLNYAQGERAAKKAYERQLDFWNKQNEYNNPANIRKRLEGADLSVGLMYSGGTAGVSNAGGLSSVPQNQSAGTHQPVRGEGYMANALNAMALQSQIELNKSSANRNNAEADAIGGYKKEASEANALLSHALAGNAKAQSSLAEFDLSMKEDLRNTTVQQAEVNLQQSRSALEKLIEDTESSRLSNTFNRKTMDTRVDTVTMGLKNAMTDLAVKAVEIKAKERGITLTESQIINTRQSLMNLMNESALTRQKESNASTEKDILEKELSEFMTDRWWRRISGVIPFAAGFVPKK